MLVSLSIENWMSFRDPTSFSMIASKERQHGERVPRLAKFQTRLLPVAAIYGGNAAGKTNFFKALSFAKHLVTRGNPLGGLIPLDTFRLDTEASSKPSRFSFVVLINEIMYEFAFSITRTKVLDEKLIIINSSSETTLYHRFDGQPHFDKSLKNDKALEYVFKGTQDNQLFLTNSVTQKIATFRPVFDWFHQTLVLVAPDTRFEPFEKFFDQGDPLYATMNEMLSSLDTGISHLGSEEVPLAMVPVPEALKARLREDVKEGTTVRVIADPFYERFIVTCKKGELLVKKLTASHALKGGKEVNFEMKQESDGSQRVIDLLPAFLELSAEKSSKVFVIDEIDRSLHTLLTRHLLESYLSTCSPEKRTQLLFTTHDVLLMDQDLLRRDEMWVAERNGEGASALTPFSDYKDVRYDKDIRKSYLQGRLGGIPHIDGV